MFRFLICRWFEFPVFCKIPWFLQQRNLYRGSHVVQLFWKVPPFLVDLFPNDRSDIQVLKLQFRFHVWYSTACSWKHCMKIFGIVGDRQFCMDRISLQQIPHWNINTNAFNMKADHLVSWFQCHMLNEIILSVEFLSFIFHYLVPITKLTLKTEYLT